MRHLYGPATIEVDHECWFFSEVCSRCGVLRHCLHVVGECSPETVLWYPKDWDCNTQEPWETEPPCPAVVDEVR